MKTAVSIAAAGAVVMAAIAGNVWAGGRSSPSGASSGGIKKAGSTSPVIVELFTSEGCSSCPSADAVLMRLEKQTSVPIIALEQHVDYWNRLGWADPFSSKQFSDRQYDYARVFRTNNVYTPQMVVDGQAEFVGSDEARAGSTISAAARRFKASVLLSVEESGTQTGTAAVVVSLHTDVGILPQGVRTGEVFAALTESGLSSQVAGGENAGRHLAHASVVRQMVSVGTIGPKGGVVTHSLEIPTGSRKENVHIIVFVQDKATRRIVGAAIKTGLGKTAL